MPNETPENISGLLRVDLLNARRARNPLAATTLQEIISAIDNAGAVPVQTTTPSLGVGSTEVPRRELSDSDIHEIIRKEISEMQHAIDELGEAQSSYIDELNDKIAILNKYI